MSGREDVALSHGLSLVLLRDEKGTGVRLLDADRRTYLTARLPLGPGDLERLARGARSRKGEAVTIDRGADGPPITIYADEKMLIVTQSVLGAGEAFREAAALLLRLERSAR